MGWRIFCYHGVPEEHAAAFGRQLDRWLDRGWRPVGFSEGLRRLGEAGMRFTVSFDDGRQSVCQVAQRILDARGVKAMLYVVTDYVCRGLTYRDARPSPACTWPQLGGWLAAGHEIGSHTHTHAVLPAASPDWAQEELERSREILQRELGCRPTHFAYPYGDHDAGTYNKLKGLGDWASAATTDRGWNDSRGDPLLLRRDAVEPDWSAMHCGLRLAVGARPALAALLRNLRRRFAGW